MPNTNFYIAPLVRLVDSLTAIPIDIQGIGLPVG